VFLDKKFIQNITSKITTKNKNIEKTIITTSNLQFKIKKRKNEKIAPEKNTYTKL